MSAEMTRNVARYCKPATIDKKRNRPLPAAFVLRKDKGETDLSVYLLEYFGNSCEKDNVKSVKKYMVSTGSWNFPQNGGFAVLNIERIKQRLKTDINGENVDYCEVSFKETGSPHYSVFFHGDEMTIQKLLAQSAHALYYVKDL